MDNLIQRYTAAEHRIGANMQELEQHSVYQLLRNGVLTGKTQAALAGTMSSKPGLWELFTLLGTSLEQCRLLRARGTRSSMSNRTDRTELERLLTTNSILLLSEDVPLAERDLTGLASREQHISIEALISRMSAIYEPLRQVVTHADSILRDVLPRLTSAETTAARLRTEARSLSVDLVELNQIDETIARIRDLSLTDPLAIPTDARAALDQALHKATETVATARVSHDALAKDVAAASDLLDECRELIARAAQSRSDALTKIARPFGLRKPPSLQAIDGERGLASKLEPIIASTEPWQVVRRRIDSWSKSATRLRDQLLRVADANARQLGEADRAVVCSISCKNGGDWLQRGPGVARHERRSTQRTVYLSH